MSTTVVICDLESFLVFSISIFSRIEKLIEKTGEMVTYQCLNRFLLKLNLLKIIVKDMNMIVISISFISMSEQISKLFLIRIF